VRRGGAAVPAVPRAVASPPPRPGHARLRHRRPPGPVPLPQAAAAPPGPGGLPAWPLRRGSGPVPAPHAHPSTNTAWSHEMGELFGTHTLARLSAANKLFTAGLRLSE
jgi:hypothetical protein